MNKAKYIFILVLCAVIGSGTGYLQSKYDIFNTYANEYTQYSSSKDMIEQTSHPPIKEPESNNKVTKNVDKSGKMKVSAYPETYVYPDTLQYSVENGKITGSIKINTMQYDTTMDFEIYLKSGIMKTSEKGSANWLETNPIRPMGSEPRYYIAKYVVDVMMNNNSHVLDNTYKLMVKRY